MWRFAIAALLSLTAGCANVNYAKTEPGKISGEMAVVWLKGTQGGSGDGTFVYVPTQRDPLTFTRPEGKDGKYDHAVDDLHRWRISPVLRADVRWPDAVALRSRLHRA